VLVSREGDDMSEELGKIEKPSVEGYKTGRRLYFVPLVYCGVDAPPEYVERFSRYWEQAEDQVGNLELKLGMTNRIYHEFISVEGEEGVKIIEGLNEKSHQIARNRLEKGAQLEAAEKDEVLTEFMDWSRCLALGLQNQQVFTRIYEAYLEASKKRNEHIAKQIDETLKDDETGVLFMREGHQVQFPADIQVFYVAPPALDEIKRWLREHESAKEKEKEEDSQ
jgi:hypothetical protein